MSKSEFDSQMRKIKLENATKERKQKLKEEKNKYRRFKKMSTSNKVLIASIIAIVLFTIACLFIQYRIGIEVSSTLITLWFSFWTVEIVALTGIKISKVFKNHERVLEEPVDETNDSNAVG